MIILKQFFKSDGKHLSKAVIYICEYIGRLTILDHTHSKRPKSELICNNFIKQIRIKETSFSTVRKIIAKKPKSLRIVSPEGLIYKRQNNLTLSRKDRRKQCQKDIIKKKKAERNKVSFNCRIWPKWNPAKMLVKSILEINSQHTGMEYLL